MRIRKRKVPFPLSSLSPVPLSDPPFADDLRQLHSNPEHNQPNHPQNSSSFSSKQEEEEDKFLCKEGRDDVDDDDQNGAEEGEKISNDSSGIHSSGSWGAKTPTTTITRELTCFLQDGKALIPLKKRRGSFRSNGEISMVNEINKDKKIMKTKDVKKRGRGGALMEGSRCSRVNGRGWRCCQPTLVGYSLCEHHLGKGRLRSMTSVRNRSAPNKVETDEKAVVGVPVSCGDDQEEKVHQQALLMSKKKHKLGMVKARSISSLLGQANKAEEEE